MSPTPKTDAVVFRADSGFDLVPASFAEELELERNELLAALQAHVSAFSKCNGRAVWREANAAAIAAIKKAEAA